MGSVDPIDGNRIWPEKYMYGMFTHRNFVLNNLTTAILANAYQSVSVYGYCIVYCTVTSKVFLENHTYLPYCYFENTYICLPTVLF